jgi:hypothetical protein
MDEEIIVTTSESKPKDKSDLRINAYREHLWFRCPADLREHFSNVRMGVFEISPPCFEWSETEEKLEFVFKWGCDLLNVDLPLNSAGISEHLWVKSLKGLFYLHPSREFNKVMKHQYEGLWMQQHFAHEWSDSGDVIMLKISWDLDQYTPPKSEEVD